MQPGWRTFVRPVVGLEPGKNKVDDTLSKVRGGFAGSKVTGLV